MRGGKVIEFENTQTYRKKNLKVAEKGKTQMTSMAINKNSRMIRRNNKNEKQDNGKF